MTKPKSKQQKKKGVKPRRSVSIASGPSQGFRRSSSAASYDVALDNPSQFRITGQAQVSKEYGTGLRCVGRQYYCQVATTAANSNLLVSNGGASVAANYAYLSPDALNGRVQTLASIYARFAFRRVRYIFITRVATTQAGGMAMAYSSDPELSALPEDTASYATTQDISPCKIFPFRKEEVVLEVMYRGDRTWFVEFDSTTVAGVRQTAQGTFIAWPDLTSIGAVTQGEIYVEYELDLYQAQTAVAMAGFLGSERTFETKALFRQFVSWAKANPDRAIRVVRALLGEAQERSGARVKPPPTLLPE